MYYRVGSATIFSLLYPKLFIPYYEIVNNIVNVFKNIFFLQELSKNQNNI